MGAPNAVQVRTLIIPNSRLFTFKAEEWTLCPGSRAFGHLRKVTDRQLSSETGFNLALPNLISGMECNAQTHSIPFCSNETGSPYVKTQSIQAISCVSLSLRTSGLADDMLPVHHAFSGT